MIRPRLQLTCCVVVAAAVPLTAAPDQRVNRPTANVRAGWGAAEPSAAPPPKRVVTKPAPRPVEPVAPRLRLEWANLDRANLTWHPWTAPAPTATDKAPPHTETQPRPPLVPPAAPAQPAPSGPPNAALHRWIDLQAATLSARYRRVETTAGVLTANQMQHNEGLRGRFTVDRPGRFVIGFGIASGASFTSGWNNAGVGTPNNFMADTALRQLYASAAPARGVEAQAGGLFFTRGEGTEITGYDNDGYLSGARVSVKRADWLGADELHVTVGHLGETTTPNVLRRLARWNGQNYWQVLVAGKQGTLGWSADLTSLAGVRTMRSAVSARISKTRVFDLVRAEAYHRFDGDASGYAVATEKSFRKRLTLGAGLADIDLNYGGLNSDRFGKGRRWFATSNVTLAPEFSLLTFYQHAFGNGVALGNRSRIDLILQFNALKALQRYRMY